MRLFSFLLVPDWFLLDLFIGPSSVSKTLNVDLWDLDLNLVFLFSCRSQLSSWLSFP